MLRYSILAGFVLMYCTLGISAQGVTLVFHADKIAPGQTATLQAPGGPKYSATFDNDNLLVHKINAVIAKWDGLNLYNYIGAVTLVLNALHGVAPGQIVTIDEHRNTLDETTLKQIWEIVQDYFQMSSADFQ